MRKSHKAMMNPKVAEFFLEKFTQEGDVIYDPFMGCGTTAIVSKKLRRDYIGSEIVKEYCEICEKELTTFNTNDVK